MRSERDMDKMNGVGEKRKSDLLLFTYVLTVLQTQNLEPNRTNLSFTTAPSADAAVTPVALLHRHHRRSGLDYRHGGTAAGRGGSRTIPILMSPPSASSAEARKAKVEEEDEMVAEEEGVEEERKRRPAPLP